MRFSEIRGGELGHRSTLIPRVKDRTEHLHKHGAAPFGRRSGHQANFQDTNPYECTHRTPKQPTTHLQRSGPRRRRRKAPLLSKLRLHPGLLRLSWHRASDRTIACPRSLSGSRDLDRVRQEYELASRMEFEQFPGRGRRCEQELVP